MLAQIRAHDENRAVRIEKELMDSYPKQPYAVMAAYMRAKQNVTGKKYDDALKNLTWAIAHSKDKAFKQIARMRAARVMIALGKKEDAKKLLAKVDDKSFVPMVNEIQKMLN